MYEEDIEPLGRYLEEGRRSPYLNKTRLLRCGCGLKSQPLQEDKVSGHNRALLTDDAVFHCPCPPYHHRGCTWIGSTNGNLIVHSALKPLKAFHFFAFFCVAATFCVLLAKDSLFIIQSLWRGERGGVSGCEGGLARNLSIFSIILCPRGGGCGGGNSTLSH